MRLRIDQILKPGVTLTVEMIDFTDEKVIGMLARTKEAQKKLRGLKDPGDLSLSINI